jgi:hypothetical protein
VTFQELQQDVYRRLNYADAPATAVATRIKMFLNLRHRQILAMPGMSRLRDANTTFVSVAGTSTYQLAAAVMRIKTIYDPTNQIKLEERDLAWLRYQDPQLGISANPEYWIPLGNRESTGFRWTIQLWPVPATAITYSMDYVREITDMSANADLCLLPPDFHYLLSLGARIDEYEKTNDPRMRVAQAEWDKGVRRLYSYVINNDDLFIVPGSDINQGISNLGPWFPEGAW